MGIGWRGLVWSTSILLPVAGVHAFPARPRVMSLLFARASPLSFSMDKETPVAVPQRCASSFLTNVVSKRSRHESLQQRPGRFTYLKVEMDNATMETLHGLACEVQRMLDNKPELPQTEIASTPPANNIKFQPRSRDSLHMTLFFGGEAICNLPAKELKVWHNRVEQRLGKSGFSSSSSGLLTESVPLDEDFSFQFVGLRVFPPHRKNLIVAEFEPSAAWRSLHGDLIEIARDESSYPTLTQVTTRNPPRWIAHVTLGNLQGGSKENKSSLDLGPLRDINISTKMDPTMAKHLPAKVVGIALGGPQPRQISLDWSFRYEPTRSREKSKLVS